VVDLEWNRKTIFEKLDWLKDALEKLIETANRNMSVHQEQLSTIISRLTALERPVKKSVLAKKTVPAKKPQRVALRRTKRQPPSKRTR
jgi:hypothetical protein